MADSPNPSDQDHGPSSEYAEEALSSLLAETPELWEVVQKFAASLPLEVDRMTDALDDGSYERLAAIAEDLKTAGTDHGYASVSDRPAAIEQAAHNHALDELSGKLAELHELALEIHVAIGTPEE